MAPDKTRLVSEHLVGPGILETTPTAGLSTKKKFALYKTHRFPISMGITVTERPEIPDLTVQLICDMSEGYHPAWHTAV